MKKVQISVFLENRTGQLVELTKTLFEHGIDLRAIHITETSDYGLVRLVADDNEKAIRVLKENNFAVSLTEVAIVTVPDEPGGLYRLLDIVAQAGLNIDYMYSMISETKGAALMILKTENVDLLIEELKKRDFKCTFKKDCGIKN